MNFDNKTVTYSGATLLAHSDAIQKPTIIDSIIISSNIPSGSADYAKLTFGDFGNYKEFPVINIRQNDNTFQPESLISNDGFNRDFTMTMVGLKGHTDGESNSTLIAVSVDNSNAPFTIPAQTSVPYKLYLDLPIGYSNSKNVQMNVNNAGMVTSDEVNQAISIAISALETQTSHNADITSLSTQIQNVSSAVANNSGIASSFSSVSSGIATNSADVTKLKTSVTNNATSISNLDNNKVQDNHDGTVTVNGNLYAITKTLTKAVDFNTLTVPGTYLCPLGIGAYTNSPLAGTGTTASVILQVTNDNAGDIFQTAFAPTIYTPITRQYSFAKWSNWLKIASNTDLVNLQNQVNGVLARQSNIIQTMLNNALNNGAIYAGASIISAYYNTQTNILTFTSTAPQSGEVQYESVMIYVYAKALGYSNVSYSLINGNNYWTSLERYDNFKFTLSTYVNNVSLNGLQMQVTFS